MGTDFGQGMTIVAQLVTNSHPNFPISVACEHHGPSMPMTRSRPRHESRHATSPSLLLSCLTTGTAFQFVRNQMDGRSLPGVLGAIFDGFELGLDGSRTWYLDE
jgi:hypothetical protein